MGSFPCWLLGLPLLLAGRSLNRRLRPASKSSKKIIQLIIRIEFKSLEFRETFMELFTPLAKHVARHEGGTLAYEVSISDSNPLEICIFERYGSRQYLEEVHQKSEAYLTFRDQVDNRIRALDGFAAKSGQSFVECNLGRMRAPMLPAPLPICP